MRNLFVFVEDYEFHQEPRKRKGVWGISNKCHPNIRVIVIASILPSNSMLELARSSKV